MKKVNLLFFAALAVILLAGCKGGMSKNQHFYKVGDYYPDPAAVYNNGVLQSGTAAIGIVYWLNPDAPGYDAATKSGTSGKIVSLDEPSNSLSWGARGVATGATSYFDGLANMAVVKKKDNTFSAYPAFAWADQKNGAGGTTNYASGAKEIWYLPAVAELQYLLCAVAGKPCETWGFPGSDNDHDYPSFNPRWGVTIDLSGFNNKLISAGGVPFSASYYWISAEDGITYAWQASFNNGNTNNGASKTFNSKARCLMQF